MELILSTDVYDSLSTEGKLFVDGLFECYTLELPFTDGKQGSAIAGGRYQIKLLPSPKFQQSEDPWVKQYADAMPHVIDVDGREYIMFHWGNDEQDTDGCILTGETRGVDFIGSSRKAFAAFYEKIKAAAAEGTCFLNVGRRAAST